jgi:hypothetical protein
MAAPRSGMPYPGPGTVDARQIGIPVAVEVCGRRVTRRAALRALGGSVLAVSASTVAACEGAATQSVARHRPTAARRRLAADIHAALAVHPDLAGRLDPLLAYHQRHAAVVAAGYQDPPATASPTPGPSTSHSPTPHPAATATVAVPATSDAATAWVAAAERAASTGRTTDILAASGDLARLLASIAACEIDAARTLGG